MGVGRYLGSRVSLGERGIHTVVGDAVFAEAHTFHGLILVAVLGGDHLDRVIRRVGNNGNE